MLIHRLSWWRNVPALRFLTIFFFLWVGARLSMPEIWAQRMERPMLLAEQGLLFPRLVQRPLVPAALRQGAMVREPVAAARSASQGRLQSQLATRDDRAPHRAGAVRSAPSPLISPQSAELQFTPSSAKLGKGLGSRSRQPAGNQPKDSGFSRQMAGWSLSSWALLREAGAASPSAIVGGELGGSQAGARLAYGFGKTGRLRAYSRYSVALERTQQSELAFGFAYAPFASAPFDVAIERREKLGSEGRSAMAAMVVGGVSGRALPMKFQLDAYGQAGMVGLHSQDLFADGAAVIDRSLNGRNGPKSVRFGAIIAGAAQPDLSRLDIGPRVTLPIPRLGNGGRIALDWRERVAGNAQPDGGLALTLGADF